MIRRVLPLAAPRVRVKRKQLQEVPIPDSPTSSSADAEAFQIVTIPVEMPDSEARWGHILNLLLGRKLVQDTRYYKVSSMQIKLLALCGDEISGVYFVRSSDTRLVKIGMSKDIHGRVTELQTAHPVPLSLIAFMPVYSSLRRAEKWFHLQLAPARVRGEWFDLSDEAIWDAINFLPGDDQLSEWGYKPHVHEYLSEPGEYEEPEDVQSCLL